MDASRRKLILFLIAEQDLVALNRIISEPSEDFIAVNALIQSHARNLAEQRGFVLSSDRFPFQELIYLLEREGKQELIKTALQTGKFKAVYDYIQGLSGIRRPAIVFELLLFELDSYASDSDALDGKQAGAAKLMHLCIQRMYPKRDVYQLFSFLKEAIASLSFWDEFADAVALNINVDFTTFEVDIALAVLLEESGRTIYRKLSSEQKLLVLPHLLKELGLLTVLAKYRKYIAHAIAVAEYDWLETKAVKSAPEAARNEIKTLILKK